MGILPEPKLEKVTLGGAGFSKYGGRKWLTGLACLITEVTLLCCDKITEITFKELFIATLVIAVGANVAQKIWGKQGENK